MKLTAKQIKEAKKIGKENAERILEQVQEVIYSEMQDIVGSKVNWEKDDCDDVCEAIYDLSFAEIKKFLIKEL